MSESDEGPTEVCKLDNNNVIARAAEIRFAALRPSVEDLPAVKVGVKFL